jgi:hypothetical protein
MTTNSKLQGLFRKSPEAPKAQAPIDPWRSSSAPAPLSQLETKITKSNSTVQNAVEDTEHQQVTLHFKGYGGISVEGVSTNGEAAGKLLNFLVENEKDLEEILTDNGFVLVKISTAPKSPFYIQRADGWALVAPEVASRDIGFFQFIQALLEMKTHGKLGTTMKNSGIRPYKM